MAQQSSFDVSTGADLQALDVGRRRVALRHDVLDGGSGSDTYVFAANWGIDTLSDSSGVDLLDFSPLGTWVRVDLASDGTGYGYDLW